MDTLTIDRFEGDIAVCEKEDMTTINIPIRKLPSGVKVGNVLVVAQDGTMSIDEEEEKRRRERIYNLYDDIFNKGQKDN